MPITRADIGVDFFRRDGRLIVSYPKSGRTWVGFALAEHGIDVTVTHAGSSTNRREIGRRCDRIPAGLHVAPLVFLHRDPLDTAVSMFRQVTRRDLRRNTPRWWRMALPLALRGALPPDDIDRFVLHPLHGLERVCAFNRMWLDALDGRGDCLVLTYEALRQDAAASFDRIACFMRLSGITGAGLAEAASFDRMRAAEERQIAARRDPGHRDAEARKVRRGVVGGYARDLRPETVAACQVILARYGFSTGQPVAAVMPDRTSAAAYSEPLPA